MKEELIILSHVKSLVEVVRGMEVPFHFGRVIQELKNEYPEFSSKWKKSREFADFLEKHELVKLVYPNKDPNLYLQPLVSPREWHETLQGILLEKYNVIEKPITADAFDIPVISSQHFADMLDLKNEHEPEEIYRGSIRNNYADGTMKSLWYIHQNIVYGVPASDFESYNDIQEIVDFGIVELTDINEYQKVVWDNYNILSGHPFVRIDSRINNGKNIHYETMQQTNRIHQIYEIMNELVKLGFEHIDQYTEAQKLQVITHSQLETIKEMNDDQKYLQRIQNMFDKESEKNLNHALYAVAGGFSSLKEYFKALKIGVIHKSDYEIITKSSFGNAKEYFDARDVGFSDSALYKDAIKRGYSNYNEYEEGFENRGFEKADDYRIANKQGFYDPDEYAEAVELNIRNYSEYKQFKKDLNKRKKHYIPLIEDTLAMWKKGTYALSKIKEKIPKVEKLSNKELEEYLLDKKIKKLGTYDEDSGIFQLGDVKQIPKAETSDPLDVVVDTSNVAYEGFNSDIGDKPSIQNILLLKEKLDEHKLKYVFLVRSNLKNKIDDSEKFQALMDNRIVIEAPSGTEDDYFIIQHALKENAMIISNDKFRDWIKEYPKQGKRIRKLRCSFRIVNDIVSLDQKFAKRFGSM